ncbi:MAG: preprotein translocase subunit YajC [Bacteroidia bacterium]|jgi:preprotein translocase subunit YajC
MHTYFFPAPQLLMAPPAQGGPASANPIMSLLPWILIFVVIWFFMIRPQRKKDKEQKLFRDQLGKGRWVITIGGVHGKILEVSETTLVIETEGQGRLKIEKSAVSVDSTLAAYPDSHSAVTKK